MEPVLFFCPEMAELAAGIRRCDPAIELGEISWQRFRDKMPDIAIGNVERTVKRRDIGFLACLNDPAELFAQLSVIRALSAENPRSLKIILPFFPGQQDRADKRGVVVTSETLAHLIDAAPRRRVNVELVTWDIHALQIREYFHDVLVSLETATDLLRERVRDLDSAIVFPDDGAFKRFGGMFPSRALIVCQKTRHGDERVVSIKDGDARGRQVIIVDDLVQTGGTLIECALALKQAGAASVSAFVAHGVFPEQSWVHLCHDPCLDPLFEHVWITDSCPETVARVRGQEPFEILSLDRSIARVLNS